MKVYPLSAQPQLLAGSDLDIDPTNPTTNQW